MKYEQLTDKQKEKTYERWVNSDPLDYNWWDFTYENWIEDGKERGFHIDKIYFSGFSSQGDGACWEGYFELPGYLAWEEKQEKGSIFTDHELVILRTALAENCLDSTYKIEASGYYSHSGTMKIGETWFDVQILAQDRVTEGPLAGIDAHLFETMLDGVCNTLEETMLKLCRDYADDIYAALEEEYEYLLSEECFKETAEANDWEFNDEGELNG